MNTKLFVETIEKIGYETEQAQEMLDKLPQLLKGDYTDGQIEQELYELFSVKVTSSNEYGYKIVSYKGLERTISMIVCASEIPYMGGKDKAFYEKMTRLATKEIDDDMNIQNKEELMDVIYQCIKDAIGEGAAEKYKKECAEKRKNLNEKEMIKMLEKSEESERLKIVKKLVKNQKISDFIKKGIIKPEDKIKAMVQLYNEGLVDTVSIYVEEEKVWELEDQSIYLEKIENKEDREVAKLFNRFVKEVKSFVKQSNLKPKEAFKEYIQNQYIQYIEYKMERTKEYLKKGESMADFGTKKIQDKEYLYNHLVINVFKYKYHTSTFVNRTDALKYGKEDLPLILVGIFEEFSHSPFGRSVIMEKLLDVVGKEIEYLEDRNTAVEEAKVLINIYNPEKKIEDEEEKEMAHVTLEELVRYKKFRDTNVASDFLEKAEETYGFDYRKEQYSLLKEVVEHIKDIKKEDNLVIYKKYFGQEINMIKNWSPKIPGGKIVQIVQSYIEKANR